jgi:putative endonuclease
MKTQNKKRGDLGELIAQKYLQKRAYKILYANYKRKWGEIDIIAQKKHTIFFIEVKTIAQASKFGSPFDKINNYKMRKLLKCAELFLIENKYAEDINWQIDVIGIVLNQNDIPEKITHLKDVI